MTLREGSTLNILTGNTDVMAFADKRTEGESLSSSPVDILTLLDSLLAVAKIRFRLRWTLKPSGAPLPLTLSAMCFKSFGVNSSGKVRQDFGGQLLG